MTTTTIRATARRFATVAALGAGIVSAAAPRAALAQLPSASASSLGLGDNYTALANGYNAVAWNPARLAMPGSPHFSLALLPARLGGGLDPITLSDVADYSGVLL